MRVSAFTGGRTISSARFRVRQYIPSLRARGIVLLEHTAPLGAWPPANRALRPLWGVASLASRIPAIASSYRSDVTLLQREFISTLCTLEPFTKSPRILDLDDAVWMGNESQIRRLVRSVDGVICGNAFIADWVSRWSDNTTIIPTPVDTARWTHRSGELASANRPAPRIIGWSGLHAGAKYLLSIEPALAEVLRRYPDVRLRIVSDRRPTLRDIPESRVEFVRWSPENEVATMQEMTIGVMPLLDTLWERGKCSYKMLLYMACGLPVVVSPVGMNGEVLQRGAIGLAASSTEEWISALSALLDDPSARRQMGAEGRRIVERDFSLNVLSQELSDYLVSFVA